MAGDKPFVNALKGWDEEESIVAAKQVEQLLAHPGWEALQKLIAQAEESTLDRLMATRTLEHAEYAREFGYLQGLREPRVAAQAFLTHAERVTRRNEQPTP